jgi:2',3'-cyclic-nucleotide 2'-phosphodiesterase
MIIAYLGDVMGETGMSLVEQNLGILRAEHAIDLVVVQAENVTEGKGMTTEDMARLKRAGVDFFTGGNHTPSRKELYAALLDPAQPVIGPANMKDCPGTGWKFAGTNKGRVLIISLLGSTVGREQNIDNPLHAIDAILAEHNLESLAAIIVSFHGDYSSEKVIIGHYLDGRVSMVVGDHWHVPTADAGVLPKGTAHITDVGMIGVLDSSLGVTYESVIPRWRDGLQTKNQLEENGRKQFNMLLVEVDEKTSLAKSCQHIRTVTS